MAWLTTWQTRLGLHKTEPAQPQSAQQAFDNPLEQNADPLETRVRQALSTVIDPEVGLDIVSLGLVEHIALSDTAAHVELLVTTPACPLGEFLQFEATAAVRAALPEMTEVQVSLNREKLWHPGRMSPQARHQLGTRP